MKFIENILDFWKGKNRDKKPKYTVINGVLIDPTLDVKEQLEANKTELDIKNDENKAIKAAEKVQTETMDEDAEEILALLKENENLDKYDKGEAQQLRTWDLADLSDKVTETVQKKVELKERERKATEYFDTDENVIGRLPNIKKFWNYLKVQNRGVRTIQEYQWEYNWWVREADKLGIHLYLLKFKDIETILTNIKPITIRRKTSFLRKLAKFYLRENKAKLHNEVSKLDMPKKTQSLPGDLGPDKFVEYRELARIWCAEGKQEGIWLGLMLVGGLRISEIQTVEIKTTATIKVQGKGRKERFIPIPNWLISSIAKTDKKLWVKNRVSIWKKLAYDYQIRHPHNLRHTYASECLRRGKLITEVKELLGHENIATTSIYSKITIPKDVANLLDS